MSTAYPSALDSFTNPTPTSRTDRVDHAQQHSDANDAIEALETKVGCDSSTDEDSLDYRIASLESGSGADLEVCEMPTGDIDGANTTFTVTDTPRGGLSLYLNGLLQKAGEASDYTISEKTITMTSAPHSGDSLIATYLI